MNNEELEFLYKKLEKYSNFAEDNNEERFLEIVDKITFYKDPKSISVLLKYFDDDETSWILESLKSAIKSPQYLNEENFTKGILEHLYVMFDKAEEWAEGFMYVILNEPKCLEVLCKNLHLVDKNILIQLFNVIYKESEAHRPVIDELRKLINKEK